MRVCEYIYCNKDISHMRKSARFCSRKHKEYARYHREGDYYNRKNRIYNVMAHQENLDFCRWCGFFFNIEIHHLDGSKERIKETKRKNPDRNNDPDNLLIMCHSCHLGLHAMAYKESKIDGWWVRKKPTNLGEGNSQV